MQIAQLVTSHRIMSRREACSLLQAAETQTFRFVILPRPTLNCMFEDFR